MKTNRTIRYRLYPPTRAKHQALHGTAGACRYVWNHFVAKLKDDYAFYGKCDYHYYSIGKLFTVLRKHCDRWLQDYSAYIVKHSLQPIETAYKEFFKGQRGLPKFKGKYTSTPSFPINTLSARLAGNHIYIQRIGWLVFGGGDRYKDEVFVSGRVKYECGKWYVYLTYQIEVSQQPYQIEEVGIDRNVGQVALSDGTFYRSPDLKRKEARRRRYQRMVARREKGSNRRKSAKLKLKKAYQAEGFARANWCHQTSKLIAKKYNMVYMEDLNTSGMTKSAKGTIDNPGTNVAAKSGLNREILKSGWGKLEQCLNYKAKVMKVPAHYTSQTCSKCGAIERENRKTQARFKCIRCGHEDNADINAALNILAVGRAATGRGDSDIGSVREASISSLTCLPS